MSFSVVNASWPQPQILAAQQIIAETPNYLLLLHNIFAPLETKYMLILLKILKRYFLHNNKFQKHKKILLLRNILSTEQIIAGTPNYLLLLHKVCVLLEIKYLLILLKLLAVQQIIARRPKYFYPNLLFFFDREAS